jgi:hypothetical protein
LDDGGKAGFGDLEGEVDEGEEGSAYLLAEVVAAVCQQHDGFPVLDSSETGQLEAEVASNDFFQLAAGLHEHCLRDCSVVKWLFGGYSLIGGGVRSFGLQIFVVFQRTLGILAEILSNFYAMFVPVLFR